jgi:hypothetical protein
MSFGSAATRLMPRDRDVAPSTAQVRSEVGAQGSSGDAPHRRVPAHMHMVREIYAVFGVALRETNYGRRLARRSDST